MAAQQDPQREGHPVIVGLVALIGVALAVGVIMGGVAIASTKYLGLDDTSSSADASGGGQSMYLPKPVPTEAATGPLVTLAPDDTPTYTSSVTPTVSPTPTTRITLQAGQTSVSTYERIDLTGVYPGGEGAILQVQRFEGGAWAEFPVTASVSNETFSTYVQTSMVGTNRFRVMDTDTGRVSNVVRIQVG